VVVFPLYVWLSSFIQKELIKYPEKRELRTRKWLLYFTLFAASIVIVGDLVTLIFRFLGGGMTSPFILKVFTVFLIAGAVFAYYAWNIKKDIPATRHPKMKLFVQGVVSIVSIAIVAGFFIAGSPQAARERQFDERRVSDLQSIQWQIINYWQSKEALPQTLGDLRDDIRGFVPPIDPETRQPYEYRTTGHLSFELCAVFKTLSIEGGVGVERRPVAAPLEPYPVKGLEIWAHKEGRTCFQRTIDPEFFPPFKDR